MLKGIDVYSGDGAINWCKVVNDGNVFAFIRGAYGNVLDKNCAINVDAARAGGLTVGVYHFFRARMDTQSQIQTFSQALQLAKIGAGDLPPVIDIEDNPNYDGPWNCADNQVYLAGLKDWVTRFKSLYKRPPIIYTRASFWAQLGNPSNFKDCVLWVASYRDGAPHVPVGWPNYSFWQYSDSGSVAGISGYVDLNYFNGDAAHLEAHLISS